MKVFIASDMRATAVEGRYYLASQHYYIVERYKNNFGNIVLCCRVANADSAGGMLDATDLLDEVIPLKGFSSVFKTENMGRIESALSDCDMFIGRHPSVFACRIADYAYRKNIPVFAEVMGDAWDAYWNHSIVGKLIAPVMFAKTKSIIKNSDYALYVTNSFLQNRYPCKNESVGVSNVLIESVDEAVLQKRLEHIARTDYRNLTLMTTAAIDVRYKGQEFVIKAIPLLNKAGIRVKYLLVGGGDSEYLRSVAKNCGVEEQVEFLGRRPLAEVFEILDKIDIYLQPSLQEGLPRSVIEAMSRGCACIGAKTAGIPELIDEKFVVRRKSVSDITDAICRYANLSSEQKTEISKRNFEEAKKYEVNCLNARRNEYFSHVVGDIGKSAIR